MNHKFLLPLDSESNKFMKNEYFMDIFVKKQKKEEFMVKLVEKRKKLETDHYLLREQFFYYPNTRKKKKTKFHMSIGRSKCQTVKHINPSSKVKNNLYNFEINGTNEEFGKVILQNKKILFKPVNLNTKISKSLSLPIIKPYEKPKKLKTLNIPIKFVIPRTEDEIYEYMRVIV